MRILTDEPDTQPPRFLARAESIEILFVPATDEDLEASSSGTSSSSSERFDFVGTDYDYDPQCVVDDLLAHEVVGTGVPTSRASSFFQVPSAGGDAGFVGADDETIDPYPIEKIIPNLRKRRQCSSVVTAMGLLLVIGGLVASLLAVLGPFDSQSMAPPESLVPPITTAAPSLLPALCLEPSTAMSEHVASFLETASAATMKDLEQFHDILAPYLAEQEEPCFPSTPAQWEALIVLVDSHVNATLIRWSDEEEIVEDSPMQDSGESSGSWKVRVDDTTANQWLQSFVGIVLVQTLGMKVTEDNVWSVSQAEVTSSLKSDLLVSSSSLDPALSNRESTEPYLDSFSSSIGAVTESFQPSISDNKAGSTFAGDLPEGILDNVCDWAGVGCSSDKVWRSLELGEGQSIKGTIPTELGLLTNLELLVLSDSPQLVGNLPERVLSQLTRLQVLYLEHTGLSGTFPALSTLSSLTDLRLYNTPGILQHGFLPVETLKTLSNLRWLDMGQERTDKTPLTPSDSDHFKIPSEISLLTKLQGIMVGHNGHHGTVPTEIGTMTNLQFLDLSRNSFEGTLPTEIVQLTNLDLLSLRASGLSGNLPPAIGNFEKLSTFDVGGGSLFDADSVLAVMKKLELKCSCGMFSNQILGLNSIFHLPAEGQANGTGTSMDDEPRLPGTCLCIGDIYA